MACSKKEKVKPTNEKVGGLAFFTSLVFLTLLAGLGAYSIPSVVTEAGVGRSLTFIGAIAIGSGLAHLLIKDHLSVFLHELKHSIVSNLAGNRARGMKIKRNRGHFEYEYTDKTAAYNAFISLAPYYFPLFAIVTAGLASIFFWHNPLPFLLLIGCGVGADLELGLRDIGPHQSDFTSLRGGYVVGLFYVIMMNITLWSLWFSFAVLQLAGVQILGLTIWEWAFATAMSLKNSGT